MPPDDATWPVLCTVAMKSASSPCFRSVGPVISISKAAGEAEDAAGNDGAGERRSGGVAGAGDTGSAAGVGTGGTITEGGARPAEAGGGVAGSDVAGGGTVVVGATAGVLVVVG